LREPAVRRECGGLIIPAVKSVAIGFVDPAHLLDGEGEAVCSRASPTRDFDYRSCAHRAAWCV